MNSVLVLGSDEFFGLTLCENLLDEGFEVHAVLLPTQVKEKQNLIEERLLWLGRNEHFHVEPNETSQEYKRIYIIYSPELADDVWKDREHPIFLLVYDHEIGQVRLNEEEQKHVKIIPLPKMYGPWDMNYKKERPDDCFFVNDVADKLVEETSDWKRKKFLAEIEKKTSEEEADKLIEQWQRQIPTKIDKI